MIEIPAELTRITVQREGDPGRLWLATLPQLAEDLLQRWNCVPVAAPTSGQVGIVIPVRRDGADAVLKISFTHPGNVHEPDALAAWNGHGAVRLYERDDAHFALLLERAGPRTLRELDAEEILRVGGTLSRRLAVPAPPGLPRLRDQAQQWEIELIKNTEILGRPLPAPVVDAALATFRELGPGQPDTLIHGDLHSGNVLSSERESWLVIDPKGLAGDPAQDAAILIRTGGLSLVTAPDLRAALLRRIEIFCDAAEIDRDRTIRWIQACAVLWAYRSRLAGDPDWIVRMTDQVAGRLLR